jgi:hypothetical protein
MVPADSQPVLEDIQSDAGTSSSKKGPNRHPFFISAPRNLEPLLVEELREMGIDGAKARPLGVEVSLNHAGSYTANNGLLLFPGESATTADGASRAPTAVDISLATHTPVVPCGARARYDLAREPVLGWIKGSQQRKCTLCLEEMRDPAATSCGHVFCWSCIGDWVREKPECPLCRREALVQHILPLRAALAV